MIILNVVFGRGITLLDLPYQQIPRSPGKLIASHLVLAFTFFSIIIASLENARPAPKTTFPAILQKK